MQNQNSIEIAVFVLAAFSGLLIVALTLVAVCLIRTISRQSDRMLAQFALLKAHATEREAYTLAPSIAVPTIAQSNRLAGLAIKAAEHQAAEAQKKEACRMSEDTPTPEKPKREGITIRQGSR